MKVVLAHPVDPSFSMQGGAVRYVLGLLNYLEEQGVEVTLIGNRYGRQRHSRHFTFISIDGHASSRSWQLYFLGLLLKLPFLRLPKNAIVHTCRLDYIIPFIIYYPTNPKIVTLDRQTMVFQMKHPKLFRMLSPALIALMRIGLRYVDRVITDRSTLEFYRNIYPQIERKTVVIPTSFVDLNKFRPLDRNLVRSKYGFSPQEKIVIFVGRVEREKNLRFLIKCFSFVKKNHPNTRLLIVGRGSPNYQRDLQNLANELNLIDDVTFMGEKKHEEMPQILNCADVLALCSLTEGSPTVVREALACGVPVVSTSVGDIRTIIKKETIGKVVGTNEQEFSEGLIDFLNTTSDMTKIERVNVLRKLGMDFEGVVKRIVRVYQELS